MREDQKVLLRRMIVALENAKNRELGDLADIAAHARSAFWEAAGERRGHYAPDRRQGERRKAKEPA